MAEQEHWTSSYESGTYNSPDYHAAPGYVAILLWRSQLSFKLYEDNQLLFRIYSKVANELAVIAASLQSMFKLPRRQRP